MQIYLKQHNYPHFAGALLPNSFGSNLLKYLRHCSLLWDGRGRCGISQQPLTTVCMCVCIRVSLVPMMRPLEARNLLACRTVCGAFLLGSAYGWAKATALPLNSYWRGLQSSSIHSVPSVVWFLLWPLEYAQLCAVDRGGWLGGVPRSGEPSLHCLGCRSSEGKRGSGTSSFSVHLAADHQCLPAEKTCFVLLLLAWRRVKEITCNAYHTVEKCTSQEQ